jgi:MFS family permease
MSSPLVIAGAAVSGLAIGFVPALVDSLRAPLAKQLKGTERTVNGVLNLFYLAWLPAMPLSGWLLDHWRNKEVLFFGLLACVLGIAWLGMAQSLRSLASSAVLLGVGYSWVATGGIRLMADALRFTEHSSHIGALNVGFVCVSLGAVIAPWVAARTEGRRGLRQGLLYLSLVLVAAAILVFVVPREQFPQLAESMPWREVVGSLKLWLLAALIVVYFAIENCFEVWPEPYLKEIGYEGRGLTIALLVFWAAFTIARAGMGWLPQSGANIWLLLGLVLASSFIMGNLVGANEYSSGSLGFWATGACYGPLLPGFLALVMEVFPDLPATALGIMLALSGLDTLIVRPVMTGLARRKSARMVMRVPTVLGLLMAAPLLVLALLR